MRCTIFALLILALVACGGSSSASPTSGATPSIPAPTQRTTETPTALPATRTPRSPVVIPTPRNAPCGTVEVRDNRVINPADAQAAEECFWQAYQQCAVDRTGTIVVRESTDETPYVDSTYGPATFRAADVRQVSVIVGDDGACTLRVSLGVALYRRTQAGTPLAGPGEPSVVSSSCTGMVRSTDGGLQVIGCQGRMYEIAIPPP